MECIQNGLISFGSKGQRCKKLLDRNSNPTNLAADAPPGASDRRKAKLCAGRDGVSRIAPGRRFQLSAVVQNVAGSGEGKIHLKASNDADTCND